MSLSVCLSACLSVSLSLFRSRSLFVSGVTSTQNNTNKQTNKTYVQIIYYSKHAEILRLHYYPKHVSICSITRATSRFITLRRPKIDLKIHFSFLGAFLWNAIPAQINPRNSHTSFKSQIHKWFRNRMLLGFCFFVCLFVCLIPISLFLMCI